ncbi:MAG: DUF418 domain-containing protein [Flavobacteriaceae bacterium]|nr:DUF418 domain-containing protein [Flavobacteriaceae bacterium]
MAYPVSWSYFGKWLPYIPSSLLHTAIGNLTNGKIAVMLWNYENGRFFQTASLFMLGMLAGRRSIFEMSPVNKDFCDTCVPLHHFYPSSGETWASEMISSEALRRPLETIISSWANIAFMLVLVAVFYLLFRNSYFQKKLAVFSPIGRMSLSNYVFQTHHRISLLSASGLALYKYTGATYSLVIGIVFATILGLFSTWWMKRHKHGPLETLWHKATWAFSK